MDRWLTRVEVACMCGGTLGFLLGVAQHNEGIAACGIGLALLSAWFHLE